jgi:hypothetical protein
MRIFFAGQGRTKVCGEAYFTYAAVGNLRRTPPRGKKAIYGWTLIRGALRWRAWFIGTGFIDLYSCRGYEDVQTGSFPGGARLLQRIDEWLLTVEGRVEQ